MLDKENEKRKDLEALAKKWGYTIDWVSPKWEPVAKCPEEDRNLFMFGLHVLSLTQPEELGMTEVKWSNCDPERAFVITPD